MAFLINGGSSRVTFWLILSLPLILNSKSWDFDLRLGDRRICIINGQFFSKLWKNKEKDRFDPQPNSSIQTKAQELLYMEREFIAQHIKEDDLGLEHLIASLQPKKYSEDYLKHSMDFTIA